MDPEACLTRAQALLDEGWFTEAKEALNDYWRWRRGGGFEPDRGDERYHLMLLTLHQSQGD